MSEKKGFISGTMAVQKLRLLAQGLIVAEGMLSRARTQAGKDRASRIIDDMRTQIVSIVKRMIQ